ncbi:MAG: trimethylamine methyltransferase family protein [Verrucomicrobia bacterium]|nr:trimethylamine methyltransferase family protein [Verrucomicrobiota bacterium]
MRFKMQMETELLNKSQLKHLFEQAIKVWEKVPFRVQGTDEFFDYLTAYGCRVDGEKVYFPKTVINKVLAQIAEYKNKYTAQDKTRKEEWSATALEMYTHGQALHICDLETNKLRPCLEADLAAWCRAVDRFGDVERRHPTFIPQDAPLGSQDVHAFATIILNSRHLHRVSVYSAKMLPFFIEISKIVKGSLEEVKKDQVFAAKCWVNSPFMITRENIEIAMEARRRLGAPVIFDQMPVAAGASPVTVAGSLVQNTAESLAVTAMSIAIDGMAIDGSIHKIIGTNAMIDMRDICQRQAGPDLFLHKMAAAQMHVYLFGGNPPTPGIGGASVTAQTVSPQSLYEKAMFASFDFAVGGRSLGIGCLSASDVGSPVQLMLDYEMGLFFRHMLRDVSTDDEHIGLETILEMAPRGAYCMETEHTARFFREESFFPAFVDQRAPLAWAQNPTDMIDKARQRARDWFATAENQCPLSENQRRQIQALVTEADRVVQENIK